MITYAGDIQGLDWDEVAELLAQAPLGQKRRDPQKLQKAFAASHAVALAYDGARLVGVGRGVSDGQYQGLICDLAVLPEYQGRGVGTGLIKHLQAHMPVENLILYAVPGKEGFYQALGFRRMKTALGRLNPMMSAPGRGYLED